jgi:hypothetical protein
MARYIIADGGWTHIFTEYDLEKDKKVERERECRFVFDTEIKKLIHIDRWILHGYVPGSEEERADVEDSLVNANPTALESPEEWDLYTSDEMPDWIDSIADRLPLDLSPYEP